MHYLDVHSGSLQVIASIVLVAVTGIYTVVTRTMARAARDALRPYVYLDVLFHSPSRMIVIVGNSGTKVAGNVQVKLVSANSDTLRRQIEELPLITGVGHLAPGGTRRYSVVVKQSDIFPDDSPAVSLEFEFAYHDGRHVIKDEQRIDLAGYLRSLFPSYADNASGIVQELSGIAAKLPDKRVTDLTPRKACPYCGTFLARSAKKCHGCLEWLTGPSRRHPIYRTPGRVRKSR